VGARAEGTKVQVQVLLGQAVLALCRSTQLLVLLVRDDTRKDLEILVLRH
jgi:hypothetical protein